MVSFRRVSTLPAASRSKALLYASVDFRGEAILMYANGVGTPLGTHMTVIRSNGSRWTVREIATRGGFLKVQPMPNGDLLLVAPRSRRLSNGSVEPNGIVLDASGVEVQHICLGDGIDDAQTTDGGAIWVSYFDEGTTGDYGRLGWGRLSPEVWIDPIGMSGVCRFLPEGRKTTEYKPPAGFLVVNDCFALNVSGEIAWICYHPGFPIVRIGPDGSVTGWSTGLTGADAIATDGRNVLVCWFAAYPRPQCWFARLGSGELIHVVRMDIALPDRPIASIRRIIGRGPSIHVFTNEAWYRTDLSASNVF